MPNPSELERQAQEYSLDMEDMTMSIHEKLKDALDCTLEDFLGSSEPITYDSEWCRVEHEHFSGYIPFTQGGWSTLILYPAGCDDSQRPAVFGSYIEHLHDICQKDFYQEQTGEYAENQQELDAYFDKLLDSESGLDEDEELYYEYEDSYFYDACPGLELKVLYYAKDNPRNDQNHDAVLICIQTNTDAPYYRDGKGTTVYEQWFKIDRHTPAVVALHLQNALNEL